MTGTTHIPISCTGGDHKDWSSHSFEVDAELENRDRRAGHEYVPMDVFLDRKTIEEHFQEAAIRARRIRIH